MRRKSFWSITIICLIAFWGLAHAQEYPITDYDFTWRIAKIGDVSMVMQKNPSGLTVILSGPGGGLARLSMTPSEAKALGDVLKNTGAYYNEQMEKKDPNMKKQVPAGDHTVLFSSSRGRDFQVTVSKSMPGAAVLMGREQAEKMGHYLADAEGMAAQVRERIRP